MKKINELRDKRSYEKKIKEFRQEKINFLKKNTRQTLKEMILYPSTRFAGVAELADALDLGSSAARCKGSTPFARTRVKALNL